MTLPEQVWTLPEYIQFLINEDRQFSEEYAAEVEDGNVVEWVAYLTAVAVQRADAEGVKVWRDDSPTFAQHTYDEWAPVYASLIFDFEE